MNIYLMLVLLSILDDAAVLPTGRGYLRAAREKAISHNRHVYHDVIGSGIWYEKPDADGNFVSYHRSNVTSKSQQGRWATERLSGHRRFQKWSRDYYPSGKDEFARRRWEEELKEYLNS